MIGDDPQASASFRIRAFRQRRFKLVVVVGTVAAGVGLLLVARTVTRDLVGNLPPVLFVSLLLGFGLWWVFGRSWVKVTVGGGRIRVEAEAPTVLDRPPWESEWSRIRAWRVDRAAGLSSRESLTLWSDHGRCTVAHDKDTKDDFERVVGCVEREVARHNAAYGLDLADIRRRPGLVESNAGLVLAVAGLLAVSAKLAAFALVGLPQRGGSTSWSAVFSNALFLTACVVFAVQVFRVRGRRGKAGRRAVGGA